MLCLHKGAVKCDRESLYQVATPEATKTWTPIPHTQLVESARNALMSSGATIEQEEFGIYKNGLRMFGIFSLTGVADGRNLVVGIRNSHDKTFPAGLSLGNRVFVCDNLSFSGDVVVARRHTKHINRDIDRLVFDAVSKLSDMRATQEKRFLAYQATALTDMQANEFVIRAMQARVFGGDAVPRVVAEYYNPRHDDFRSRTLWSMFNAVTECLKGVNPDTLVKRTLTLHGLADTFAQVI